MMHPRLTWLSEKLCLRPVLLELMVCCALFSVWTPIAQAADPCFGEDADTPQTSSTTKGLSACQKFLYQKGIYYFDAALNDQNCVVQTSVELGGGDKPQAFYNYFINKPVGDKTLRPEQVAGLMGNIQIESGFDPLAYNPGGKAHGIVQWRLGRYDNLVKFANGLHTSPDDFGVQVAFTWSELQGPYKSSVLDKLVDTNDVATATKLVDDSYEVSGGASIAERTKAANGFLNQYGGGATSGTDQSAGGTTVAASNDTGNCSVSGPGQDSQYLDGFTVYSQYDPAWKDNAYGTSTIGDSGCGPSAMAMIITAMTGKKVTPAETAAYAGSHGMYISGAGSSHLLPKVVAPNWGLTATPISADVSKITAALQAGRMVIGSATGPLPFTSAGHYIAIRGVTSEGKWMIGDSAHKDTSAKEWDPQDILGPIIASAHEGSLYVITK